MELESISLLLMIASGGKEMVNGDFWHKTRSRFKLKESKRLIARSLGLSVQPVRKILRQKESTRYKRASPKEHQGEPV